jgi:RNA polymerase sigma factor (sigma-70 family)
LGLSHGEAEDVLQETFLALMQKPQIPANAGHYCVRSFRNHALNHRRSLWRRLTRELESQRWFERSPSESPAERAVMRCLAELPVEQREVIVLKIWHQFTFEEIGMLITGWDKMIYMLSLLIGQITVVRLLVWAFPSSGSC